MMASRSELRDRTYFLRSHARESHTTIKMLALPVLERYNKICFCSSNKRIIH